MQQWLEEYGRFKLKREVVMKSEQDKIAALEKALADAHLKLRVYDELMTNGRRSARRGRCPSPNLPRVRTWKLQQHLATRGVPVGRDHLFAVLRESGRLDKRKRRGTHTTYSRRHYAVAPNRVKALRVSASRQVVVHHSGRGSPAVKNICSTYTRITCCPA